ncbi:MAG: peptidoglycan recognition family protein [candidate division WOR-3 bacterium]
MKIVAEFLDINYKPCDKPRKIDMIVLHSTGSDDVNGVISWFKNPASQVSAHYVIDKDGTVYKLVRLNDIAWHAKEYNSRSIGIEIVHSILKPTTKEQRIALVELVAELIKNISTIKYLQGHFELSRMKSDPYERTIVTDLRSYFRLYNIRDENKGTI